MLGRQHHVRGAEQRVGARGEDADLAPGDRRRLVNVDLRALAAADPVALHGHRRLGPVERRQILEQAVGVARDAQHPLPHVLALDGDAAALAAPLADLLVGEAGLARRGTS